MTRERERLTNFLQSELRLNDGQTDTLIDLLEDLIQARVERILDDARRRELGSDYY